LTFLLGRYYFGDLFGSLLYLCIMQIAGRDIHSSPAVLTVGRIVNNFRARAALVISRLEDTDDVLQKTFDDSDTDEDSEGFAGKIDRELV